MTECTRSTASRRRCSTSPTKSPGRRTGPAVMLMHGFPYSVRGYDAAVELLRRPAAAASCRTYAADGPTRFLDAGDAVRTASGDGQRLTELLDALQIDQAVLCGFDWGGRAACIVAALWPQRCAGLVTCGGYNIQDIAASVVLRQPKSSTRSGTSTTSTPNVAGPARSPIGEASPTAVATVVAAMAVRRATFEASAAMLDNPDFVDVVIHSYRHRFGYAPGDPALEPIEERLAAKPTSPCRPSASMATMADSGPRLDRPKSAPFTGPYEQRILSGVGHNVPQEAPDSVADAVLDLSRL